MATEAQRTEHDGVYSGILIIFRLAAVGAVPPLT